MKYAIQRGLVEVRARSSIHDTTTRFPKLSGTIDFDPDAPGAARAEIALDMRSFDAGDRLKNWKLKGEIDADRYPTATFTLARFDEIHESTPGRFEAAAVGQLRWRGRTPDLKVKGQASVDRRAIDARASFELDVRDLGMTAPRILMFKIEDVTRVEVTLFATAIA